MKADAKSEVCHKVGTVQGVIAGGEQQVAKEREEEWKYGQKVQMTLQVERSARNGGETVFQRLLRSANQSALPLGGVTPPACRVFTSQNQESG